MADGLFYVDTRAPHLNADIPAVTLAATDKALVPLANVPVLGANYFAYVGKAMRLTMFGRITTAATPGTGTFDLYWGSGADANGTIIASSPAFTLIASQTSLSWRLEMTIRCRVLGAAGVGALFATGQMNFNTAVVAAGFGLIPASLPAQVLVDLTAANVLSPQFKRSGSTVETMQVHEVIYEALN
jgi:hypothetical protein